MTIQVGIPIFPIMELRGITKLKFRDNFADADEFWAWRKFLGAAPAGKSGWEAGGQYNLQVNNGWNGKWDSSNPQAPQIFMSPIAYPCEVIAKLDEVTLNDKTFAGLFLSKRPTGFGANNVYAIGRKRHDAIALNGIATVENTFNDLDRTAVVDLPIWLRLRIGCVAYTSLNVWFDYSIDGVNWINSYHQATGWVAFSLPDVAVGLYVANGADLNDSVSKNLILGKFDFFQMKPQSIN